MLHPNDPLYIGITEEELVWCRANASRPEAASVLAAYASKQSSAANKPNDSDLSRAVWNLRSLHGRPAAKIDRMFAYLLTLPGAGEDVGAYMEEGSYTVMVGADEARMRSFRRAVVTCVEQGIPTRLVEFEKGPRLSLTDIWDLPETSDRVERLIAVVNRRENGDEAIVALEGRAVLGARKNTLLEAIPYISSLAQIDAAAEIRSYVNPREVRISEA